MKILLAFLLSVVVVAAQETQAPTLDPVDRALVLAVASAQKLTQDECSALPITKHYSDLRRSVERAILSKYTDFTFDWATGTLQPKK